LPIIENNYSDETLFEINNLVSTIMLIENSRDEEKLLEHVKRVAECVRKEHIEDIRLFSKWFLRMFPNVLTKNNFDVPDKGGSRKMLAETAQKLTDKLLKQGLEQGLRQGELSEKHEVLIRLVDLKFGLSEDEKIRIRKVQEPWRLDSALDAVVTGEDKKELLEKLS